MDEGTCPQWRCLSDFHPKDVKLKEPKYASDYVTTGTYWSMHVRPRSDGKADYLFHAEKKTHRYNDREDLVESGYEPLHIYSDQEQLFYISGREVPGIDLLANQIGNPCFRNFPAQMAHLIACIPEASDPIYLTYDYDLHGPEGRGYVSAWEISSPRPMTMMIILSAPAPPGICLLQVTSLIRGILTKPSTRFAKPASTNLSSSKGSTRSWRNTLS